MSGLRSLRTVDIDWSTPATVLIGSNGSGKSNLLLAVQLVRLIAFESLQLFVGRQGGGSSLLHYGPRVTPVLEIRIEFSSDQGENAYECRLGYAAGDTLIFLDELAGFRRLGQHEWTWTSLGAGHRETRLVAKLEEDTTARTVLWLLRRLNVFHFHDTSLDSKLRTNSRRQDDRYLRSDGSNLAAFLAALRESEEKTRRASFLRIETLVRQIAPFMRSLEPSVTDASAVRLDWIDTRNERFGVSHLSDGTLRAIALFTALGQPADQLPLLCAIDEPELGLHPSALHLVCELARSAAAFGQLLLATQSPALLDEFEPHEVIVAQWEDGETIFRRLDTDQLADWLRDYSLSQLYRSNLFGSRPE